jgi:uncharacterized protein YerC
MYFEQLSIQVYQRLMDAHVLPKEHTYNDTTEQLVIWTTTVDKTLKRVIELQQGLYEMNG